MNIQSIITNLLKLIYKGSIPHSTHANQIYNQETFKCDIFALPSHKRIKKIVKKRKKINVQNIIPNLLKLLCQQSIPHSTSSNQIYNKKTFKEIKKNQIHNKKTHNDDIIALRLHKKIKKLFVKN